jgi:hypothetical protein
MATDPETQVRYLPAIPPAHRSLDIVSSCEEFRRPLPYGAGFWVWVSTILLNPSARNMECYRDRLAAFR